MPSPDDPAALVAASEAARASRPPASGANSEAATRISGGVGRGMDRTLPIRADTALTPA